ncbi:putative copper resistance protein D [Pseudomonas duriflava]|uniref:Copper resistance protein D n=1 Tax=Pseudomonas duriflava TaxID=459528 RepID=A0A562Q1E1_9PSED|nr:copper homeostasis membrane protein CopD [Pseudomonas duriflava]TWI50499.1 putative copper resistance protein D [Pseudomonas duriflava]
MSDWVTLAVRFALYIDLMLLFGLPLFGLYALRGKERISGAIPFRLLLTSAAWAGVALSLLAMVVLAKTMSGVDDVWALERSVFGMIITGTDVGQAWVVRLGALLLASGGALLIKHRPAAGLAVVSALGAVALATLAWSGHGAMDEGLRRYVHLSCDIVHLWAAGAWLGALAAFILLLPVRGSSEAWQQRLLSRTLTGFARAGTLVVALLIVTGLINYGLTVGPTVKGILDSQYGQLLLLKIALFLLMLTLAAGHRYRLAPRLALAIEAGGAPAAIALLRRSLWLEALAAIVILALVAWLGTLSPELGA